MSHAADLADGIAELGLSIPDDSQRKLLSYLRLLEKWNATYNLTAVRDPEGMLTHHVLDSLAVVPHLQGESWVDVGSGAGLPGIPIALAVPGARISLVESSGKKAAFLRQVTAELALRNASVVCNRVEQWQPHELYDVVIARALCSLSQFVAMAGRLCSARGVLAAMKGTYPREELAQLPTFCRLQSTVRLVVPGLPAERHLVLIRPA
jgi:16S rRNA (guanine527-N7)-methyltransferase